MAAAQWHLAGEYFEACNCDLICPCLVQAPPARGRCDAALAFHITAGAYEQTSLNGRTTVLVVSFPGPGKMRIDVVCKSEHWSDPRARWS